MFERITLADIHKRQCGILRNPTNTSPIIWRIEQDGVRAIVKDFSYNSFWFRNIIGRFLVWREKKAFKRLEGLSGVPVLFGSTGGIALIIEEIQGTNIETMEVVKTLDEDFFEELIKLIHEFHERGIVHCDLKRAPNIMRGNDGRPYIVDWAASISRSEFCFFPLNSIYNRFLQDDFNAVTKLKMKYRPESVSLEEKLRYIERSRAEKIIRTIKDKIQGLLKKVA